MPHLSESFGISGLLVLTTTKQTGALSREDGCKLTRPLFILLIICLFGSATPPAGNDFVAVAAGGSKSIALKSNGSIVGLGNNDGGNNDGRNG